jgi:protein dithiol:quinone oxidoreductase
LNVLSFLYRLSFRQIMALIALACVAMLGFGYYLQHVVGLEPCPMCIVQRYAMILIALLAMIALATGTKGIQIGASWLVVITALGGAFVAARQSWLQWYPPEVASCGRDIYGMIETFPLQNVIPMILKGSGDCTKVDWTFLGGSIANWSFLYFCGIAVLAIWVTYCRKTKDHI